MRLSLFILGVFSAVICIEEPAQAQNQAWCIYKDDGEGNPQCRYATLEQCLADRLRNSNCSPSPYPSSPGTPSRRPSRSPQTRPWCTQKLPQFRISLRSPETNSVSVGGHARN